MVSGRLFSAKNRQAWRNSVRNQMPIPTAPSSALRACWRCSALSGDTTRRILSCWSRQKETSWDGFLSRAKELLEEGRAVSRPASLSPRQSEILLSVIRNRANKEIASKLNITVRTVKFHISSLLNKFGVDNRAELARRAAGFLKPDAVDTRGIGVPARPGNYRIAAVWVPFRWSLPQAG